MKLTKEELIKDYVKEIRNRAGNFDRKVQASAVLFNFFKNKRYDFFFTPNMTPKDTKKTLKKTPDFLAQKSGMTDLIGEIKQSLPKPISENDETIDKDTKLAEYEQKVNKDMAQLQEYSQEITGISTPHEIFFSTPAICNDAIAYYAEKIKQDPILKDKVIILKFGWLQGNSHSQMTINKVYGDFSDNEVNKEFSFKDYQVGEGDLEQIQGLYKIVYTEEEYNQTPVEYIMLILWHNVFPEIIKTADFDKTLERIKKGENTLEFTIDDIMGILDELFTLRNSKGNVIKQFNKEMVQDALIAFEKIGKAERINEEKDNPKYRIMHSKFSNKTDLLEFLILELNKDEFEKRADLDLKRLQNQDLTKIS